MSGLISYLLKEFVQHLLLMELLQLALANSALRAWFLRASLELVLSALGTHQGPVLDLGDSAHHEGQLFLSGLAWPRLMILYVGSRVPAYRFRPRLSFWWHSPRVRGS
jgi:hypothetical protein